ncbi:MAG: tRNA (N6-threonylcarbamoyladenosine(37)-N6)-methyltransferase TrmO [Prevotella sp.]|nr:tRNA (N6-threonylcarbamoyladenosine(37)-N6)-methyltransferase TrmO [Prevotella sp.]
MNCELRIEPIAYFHSPLTSKFGVPRQSGLVESLRGRVVFEPAYRREEALRGLADFDYVWLIWGFSRVESRSSRESRVESLTVRPPRLGGNERIGVFASRSPFRPNGLGLSCVRISKIENCEIELLGADLMDGTPIYDVKPYIPYADAHPEARGGFTDKREWKVLKVEIPKAIQLQFTKEELQTLTEILSLDPRPHYHDDPNRVYGMPFAGRDIKFRVDADRCIVVER